MIQKESLMKQAYEQIKKGILENEFQTGVSYSTQYFADYLNISRTPVREAILQLQSERLVEVNQTQGVIIKNLDVSNLLHITQIRSAVDSYCAYYLTQHIQEESAKKTLQQLHALCEQQQALLATTNDNDSQMSEKWYNLDNAFHCAICAFVGNARIKKLRDNLDGYIRHIGIATATIINRKQESIDENYMLLEAIKSGDPLRAYQTAKLHVEKIYMAMINTGKAE